MITVKEAENVAKLARLALADDEKQKQADQMGKLLDYFNLLNEVNTENVEPMAQAIPKINVMRDDVMVQNFTREELLANAPLEEDSYFKVPKISEE
ncbi:MAG: Asp-tRNA(Asn)/Glu-tRNA(Gln) amidotransferase subunit GatC [bacterium]